jgi:hypothetical protein
LKLRILGNSIRLRVGKSELAELASKGTVADAIHFAPGQALTYRIVADRSGKTSAGFAASEITVTVPGRDVQSLATTDLVSIRGEQKLAAGQSLAILVEKDFECLVPRAGEDPRDLYDNPAAKR